ncbi:unnamed protein product, partial [Brachionus calyciflorus]
MRNTRNIDFPKLVKQTIDLLVNEKIHHDEILNISARDENKFWGMLCKKFFGSYKFKDSMYIFTSWKRDVCSYQSLVKEHMTKEAPIRTFAIAFSDEEFEKFKDKILTFTNQRQSFSSDFTDFLSKKLQNLGSNCLLKSDFNWFRKENSRKNGDFWVGKYSCLICKNHYKTRWIHEDMKSITIEGIITSHPISQQKTTSRIFGEKRKLLCHEIVAKGISGFRIENSLSENNMIEYTKIRRISSEFKHRYRIFNEIRVDCDAIKNVFDLLLPETFSNGIKGFVQETAINPFKMTLLSEIQIRMWDMIQQRNPVWHFDASGLFLNEINDQSKPFLFSIVCHDPVSKSFIPIGDFFTPANDALNIQLNLTRIQQTFLKYKKTYNPSVIVTDFSWASINALLRTFLNCDIIQYLKISFEKAIHFDNSHDYVFKTKIYLCSTHFLKNVIDDFDYRTSRIKISSKVRHCFIICFTMLQNSETINEFNENLFHFITIFSQKYLSHICMVSLLKLQINVKTRDVSWLKDSCQFDERKFLDKDEDMRKEIIFRNDFSDNYIRDSPFTKYFSELIQSFMEKNNSIEVDSIARNEYYYPHLMDIIKKRLHLAPLWSAFIISSEKNNFPEKRNLSRFTNNPVEAWFGYFRNNILKINKRVKLIRRLNPSEIVTPFYNYLQMKFNQHYKEICIDFSKKENSHSRNEKETEKWNFPTTSNRTKGIYYMNKFTFNKDLNSEILLNVPEIFPKKASFLVNENCEEYLSQINDYLCFSLLGEKVRFKDVFDLLNGKMLNDLVITLFMEIKSFGSDVKIFNYFQSSQIFDKKIISNKQLLVEDLSAYSSIFGLIFIPSIKHWCLFYVDLREQTFSLLDSLKASDREKSYFERWEQFCKQRTDLSQIKWKIRKFKHKFQSDCVSCGSFVSFIINIFYLAFAGKITEKRKESDDFSSHKEYRKPENHHFNEEQLALLKKYYQRNKIPNQDEIEIIRQNLGEEITKRNICVWFYLSRLSEAIECPSDQLMDLEADDTETFVDGQEKQILDKREKGNFKICKKGRNSIFNETQLKYLRSCFKNNKNPNRFEVDEIAIFLQNEFSAKQIYNWFSNSRKAFFSNNKRTKKANKLRKSLDKTNEEEIEDKGNVNKNLEVKIQKFDSVNSDHSKNLNKEIAEPLIFTNDDENKSKSDSSPRIELSFYNENEIITKQLLMEEKNVEIKFNNLVVEKELEEGEIISDNENNPISLNQEIIRETYTTSKLIEEFPNFKIKNQKFDATDREIEEGEIIYDNEDSSYFLNKEAIGPLSFSNLIEKRISSDSNPERELSFYDEKEMIAKQLLVENEYVENKLQNFDGDGNEIEEGEIISENDLVVAERELEEGEIFPDDAQNHVLSNHLEHNIINTIDIYQYDSLVPTNIYSNFQSIGNDLSIYGHSNLNQINNYLDNIDNEYEVEIQSLKDYIIDLELKIKNLEGLNNCEKELIRNISYEFEEVNYHQDSMKQEIQELKERLDFSEIKYSNLLNDFEITRDLYTQLEGEKCKYQDEIGNLKKEIFTFKDSTLKDNANFLMKSLEQNLKEETRNQNEENEILKIQLAETVKNIEELKASFDSEIISLQEDYENRKCCDELNMANEKQRIINEFTEERLIKESEFSNKVKSINKNLKFKNQQLATKDSEMAKKDEQLRQKDLEIASIQDRYKKDLEVLNTKSHSELTGKITGLNAELNSKNQQIAIKDSEMAKKDEQLRQKDLEIAAIRKKNIKDLEDLRSK